MTEDTARGFGQTLRQAREDAGLQVSDLAATTRIGARYIHALEAEDWAEVPGSVIGRGFVRVLAREVRVDPGPLVDAYRSARGEGDGTPEHALPESDWDVALRSERTRRPLLIALSALVLVLAGLWFWWPKTKVEGPIAAVDSTAPQVAGSEAPAAEPAQPPPPVVVEETPAPVASGPHHLGVQAVEKVWVRVRADDGEPQDRLLQPGEQVEYVAQLGFEVKVGSAGSVRLTWDGDALRVPGKLGEVKTLNLPDALAELRP